METIKMKSLDKENRNKDIIISWMDCLPIEITNIILTRIPLKSVFRSRSVCKTWLSIIDMTPRFSIMHSYEIPNNPSSFIIISSPCKGNSIKVFSSSSSEEVFKFPKINVNTRVHAGGSCNGLLCFYSWCNLRSSYIIYICNPITGEYVSLPHIPPRVHWLSVKVWVGFGLDPSTKVFKVIQILDWSQQWSVHTPFDVYVYALGSSNSWRKIDPPPSWWSNRVKGCPGVFVNGSVHWLDFSSIEQSEIKIVSFDFASESFKVIPSPQSSFSLGVSRGCLFLSDIFELGVLRGCLCLSDCRLWNSHYDIWVMKEYNIRESWIKQFVIRKSIIGYEDHVVSPICFQTNGELLLNRDGNFLVSYNVESGKKAIRLADDELPANSFKAFPYVASLISPKYLENKEKRS